MKRMNLKTILLTIAIILATIFITIVIAAPTAAIMLDKDAATEPRALISLVAVLAVGVTILSATMTSVRARPDDAPRSVIARKPALYAAAAFGLGGAILFGFGIVIGLLNANFTAQGNGPLVLFWVTAGLLGLGAATLLFSLFNIAWIHFANAIAVILSTPNVQEFDPVPTGVEPIQNQV